MIYREYCRAINATRPENYFENWYEDVWKRRVGSQYIDTDKFGKILTEEMNKVGAEITYTQYSKFGVKFENDTDYTVFVLKWA